VQKKLPRHINEANWFMVVYVSLVHILSLCSIFVIFDITWKTVVAFLVLFHISGLGITAGAHRLWAHRSYKASLFVRIVLMIYNCFANQGSILHWSRDHRVHHKYSETHHDPHNATRGFFYAHMGWLLLKKSDKVKEAGKTLDISDLLADPVVVFQDKCDPWINFFFCFIVPVFIGVYICGDSALSSFLILGCLRYISVLHSTWLVNSVAHKFGNRPYDSKINPAENFLVSFFAMGEGWHNWHHAYPWDYATSEYGWLKRWNPTKITIDVWAFFGLVWDRKRAVDTWNLAKKRIESQHAELGSLLENQFS